MPATSTFTHVVYNGQSTIPVSLTCADAYSVVLMFSDAVDYRIDPVSALYNRAIPCQSVATTTERIDLSLIRMTKGDGYYIIRAHEGASGMWHDPY